MFGSSWTLTFTRKEESTTLTSKITLRCRIERNLSFEARFIGFLPIDAIFVSSTAIGRHTLSIHTAHSSSCIWIACVPDASRVVVVAKQQLRHLSKEVELQRSCLLEVVKAQ